MFAVLQYLLMVSPSLKGRTCEDLNAIYLVAYTFGLPSTN